MAVVLPVLKPVPVTTTVLPPVICEEREAGQWGCARGVSRAALCAMLAWATLPVHALARWK